MMKKKVVKPLKTMGTKEVSKDGVKGNSDAL